MRVLGGVVLWLTTALFAQAQATPVIADPASRSTISLDGTWNTIVDPYESGIPGRYYAPRTPKNASELIEFDFDDSPKLHVPGDWNTQRDSLLFYEGPLWYERQFWYAGKPHARLFLYIGAANYFVRVWLNGNKLGEHTGGYTPFNFEVTGQLVEGENRLVVEVDNTRHVNGVPSSRTDWWNYGGLTRSVKLIEVPETFIENYAVHLAKGSCGKCERKQDQIDGWVQLNGAHGESVTIEIPEARVKQAVPIDASGRAVFHFSTTMLDLWSPENPKLYRVTISAGSDKITEDIGFRSIETRGTQILLNGKALFLRGIAMHDEAPFRSGRSFSEEDDRTLLTWAKQLGCNFVRLAHYPHNEDTLRLADGMGLLVWEEVPVYWEIQWQDPATLENAKAQLRDAVARDQNRAAIILWSVSNETPINAPRDAFLKALSEYARRLDSTRLITSASDAWHFENQQTATLDDPLGEFLDVLGLNEYIGWYGNRKSEDADQIEWKFAYAKPVIVSEFGADALYNLHGDSQARFTEEYQVNLYRHQLTMLSHISALAGMSPWLLMDFRSPRRPLPAIQDYFNRKGLISDRGQKKQAFYVLENFYREKQAQSTK
jgi:beta-glucuronidase